MHSNKKTKILTIATAIFLLIISILIKIASNFPIWIENNYSRGAYPKIALFFRTIFGWLPFSVGDILYTATGVYLLVIFVIFVKILFTRPFREINFKKILVRLFFILITIYIYFNLSWGLNYNRPGIAYQLKLKPEIHNEQELKMITALLLDKVNENRLFLGPKPLKTKPYPEVFKEAKMAYQASASIFPFMSYNTESVKRSLYGRMGNFLGFLGYYNPFTGEAQLNLTQPRFLIPYVSCHEMAHQLGYASESEANFVGYLAAVHSPDTLFHYSTYFDLFNYANHELYLRD
ncbi:MAG TPA: DUF3810 domain-containing protein, partial [Segetibacter sp.]